jgi:hypothetical protein
MRLELRYRSNVDLQPGMQVEIRNHIARCLRDDPHGDKGVITLAGVDGRRRHCSLRPAGPSSRVKASSRAKEATYGRPA